VVSPPQEWWQQDFGSESRRAAQVLSPFDGHLTNANNAAHPSLDGVSHLSRCPVSLRPTSSRNARRPVHRAKCGVDTSHARASDNAALLRLQLEDWELDDSTRDVIAGVRLRPGTGAPAAIQIVLRFRSNVSIVVPSPPAASPTLDMARARLATAWRRRRDGSASLPAGIRRFTHSTTCTSISPKCGRSDRCASIRFPNRGLGAQAIETALHKPTLQEVVSSLSAKPQRLLGLEADVAQVDEGLGARVLFRLLIEQSRLDPDSVFREPGHRGPRGTNPGDREIERIRRPGPASADRAVGRRASRPNG